MYSPIQPKHNPSFLYRVSPFLESFKKSRSDAEFSPFIFLLILQNLNILFISIWNVDYTN